MLLMITIIIVMLIVVYVDDGLRPILFSPLIVSKGNEETPASMT